MNETLYRVGLILLFSLLLTTKEGSETLVDHVE